MDKGAIKVFYGEGKGKTTIALGQGILGAGKGKSVIIIQFLKGKDEETLSFIKRLEPEIKLFRFEKSACDFIELSEDEQNDEVQNIKNGMNYAKKVLATGECEILILDEVLGLLDMEIIKYSDMKALFDEKEEDTELILTGQHMYNNIREDVDQIYEISTIKS